MRFSPPTSTVEMGLLEWLHGRARTAPDLTTLCTDLNATLLAVGIPVKRLNLGVFLYHPELAGVAHQVSSEPPEVISVEVTHEALQSFAYLDSPIKASVDDQTIRRYRLAPDAEQPYPVLTELQEDGFTDYLLVPMLGTLGRVHVLSIATQADDGFTQAQADAVVSFCAPFGLLVDSLTTLALSKVLFSLYVGKDTGRRVLEGEVRLGRGESIHAAVLFSDLRGFSDLCSAQGAESTIQIVNRYFEVVSRNVHDQGGEVLKLMGDAILAVFPVSHEGLEAEQSAARACLAAAQQSQRELRDQPNASTALHSGFGLTLGEVVYGNIGAPGRLDFTIIGEAVNLAARLEQLSKSLVDDLLLGPLFADRAGAKHVCLGEHAIKGFQKPVLVYGGTLT